MKKVLINKKTYKKLFEFPESYKRGLLIWVCTAFFYFFQFILRVSPSACADNLMEVLNIDAYVLGSIMSFYYTGYVMMQIPAGIVLDRLGVRKPLAVSISLCALGVFLFAFPKNIVVLSLGRFLMGVGSAFAFLSNVKVASLWFKPKHMALFIGLTLTGGTFGAVVAGSPLAIMLGHLGWQKTLIILAIMGFGHAIFSWFIIQDVPRSQEARKDSNLSRELKGISQSIGNILKNPLSWVLGAYGLLMYLPLSGFGDLWGASFIEDTYGISKVKAAAIASWMYIGIAFGSPFWSIVHRLLKNYPLEMMLSAVIALICFIYVVYYPGATLLGTSVMLFISGFALGGQFLAFAVVTQINCASVTGTSSGTHNMMCMVSGMIAQPLIGYFMTLGGSKELAGQIVYSSQSYIMGLSVITIGLLLAVISYFLMKLFNTLKE